MDLVSLPGPIMKKIKMDSETAIHLYLKEFQTEIIFCSRSVEEQEVIQLQLTKLQLLIRLT
jgi:hypothetical protein